MGVINAGVTALLGLALLRMNRPIFSSTKWLQLRAVVLLAACTKGAFFLVQGEARHAGFGSRIVSGIQFPDPIEVLHLVRQSRDSLWRPTGPAEGISAILFAFALVALVRRAVEMSRVGKALDMLNHLAPVSPPDHVTAALRQAAYSLGFSPKQALPAVFLMEVDCSTPLLLGLAQPRLVLAPSLLECVSEEELELMFRHELAHLQRRDHWRRWFLLWLQDIGWLNPLIFPLLEQIAELEEIQCDQLAVKSPHDAYQLAQAITRTSPTVLEVQNKRMQAQKVQKNTLSLRENSPAANFTFALQGRHRRRKHRDIATRKRLTALLSLSQELAQQRLPSSSAVSRTSSRILSGLRPIQRSLFWLALLIVLYLKYYVTPDVN